VTAKLSSETWIGIAVTTVAVAAMAVDHLMGDDPAIFEDPAAFLVGSTLSVLLAIFVFGLLVPRTKTSADAPELAAKRAMTLSLLSVVGILLVWLGLPFVLAGGGVALGLLALGGRRRRLGIAALTIGGLIVALGTIGYAAVFVAKL